MSCSPGDEWADERSSRTRSASATPVCINSYMKKHGLRLLKIIGEGSYSKVRLCIVTGRDGEPEKFIACKVISKQKASHDFVHKFLPRELEITNRLSHPNIIKVFDIVEYDQHVFIFMDFCNKGDLLEYIKRKGFLTERRTQCYFAQIISAVQYIHGMDLAHRDLKCENVLLCHNDLIKLSDFGFARYCHDDAGKRILSNTYCGSAAYAAPEILQGTMYNPKLYDMWSLGCILFIMLTGHMPYDESNVQQMLHNQLERLLTYPHQVESFISKPAKRLIRHLLEPDVTRRATVEQVLVNPWVESVLTKETYSCPGGSGDFLKMKEPLSLSVTSVNSIDTTQSPYISTARSCRQQSRPTSAVTANPPPTATAKKEGQPSSSSSNSTAVRKSNPVVDKSRQQPLLGVCGKSRKSQDKPSTTSTSARYKEDVTKGYDGPQVYYQQGLSQSSTKNFQPRKRFI